MELKKKRREVDAGWRTQTTRISWVRMMEKRAGDAAGLNKEAARLVRFES